MSAVWAVLSPNRCLCNQGTQTFWHLMQIIFSMRFPFDSETLTSYLIPTPTSWGSYMSFMRWLCTLGDPTIYIVEDNAIECLGYFPWSAWEKTGVLLFVISLHLIGVYISCIPFLGVTRTHLFDPPFQGEDVFMWSSWFMWTWGFSFKRLSLALFNPYAI